MPVLHRPEACPTGTLAAEEVGQAHNNPMVGKVWEISLKRAYEPTAKTDGARYLVERLWPRGVKKEALPVTAWLKDVAPSTELRQWFSHDPAKWAEFQKRYTAELKAHPAAWQPLLDAAHQGPITLIYSSHDEAHNNAVVLRAFLLGRLGHG